MSQPFNLRVILGKVSGGLYQETFSRLPVFEGYNWSVAAKGDVEPILQRLKAATGDEQRRMGIRLRQVHALGNSLGTRVLLKAGFESKLTTLGADFNLLKNAYERAFWCLAKHETLFDHPLVYAYTHSLPKDARETRIGFPPGKIVVTDEVIAEVVRTIKEAYKDEERADLCWTDHREHDGVHLIQACPSDYVDEIETYLTDGQLSLVTVRPPFHIACYVDESAGAVTVLAKGGADKHEALFQGFGKALFGASAPPRAGTQTYDLSVFKNPNHEFWTDPAHHMSPPRVVKMRIRFPESRYHIAMYEVNPDDPHDDIYRKVIEPKLQGGLRALASSTILGVELQVVFKSPGQPEEPIPFKITFPRWCTLEHDGRDGIIRRHLRPWGVENDGKRVAASPKTTRVA